MALGCRHGLLPGMIESALRHRIEAIVGGIPIASDAAGQVRGIPGAYVLLIELAEPLRFERPALGCAVMEGALAYVGSARGGGGIGARLARHFRLDKPVRWHVDELTNRAAAMAALAVPEGSECDLATRLLASGLFEPAMRGFGSSDCRGCLSHLFRPA